MKNNMVLSESYFDFLAYLMKADEKIHKSEIDHIKTILNELNISNDERKLYLAKFESKSKLPPIKEIYRSMKKEIPLNYLPFAIKEFYYASQRDGSIDKKETKIIEDLLREYNIREDNFPMIRYWALESIALQERGGYLFEEKAE
jgi:hypothetical protein